MLYIVYKTVRLETGEYYIGVHGTEDLNDQYLGSGTRLKNAISKYGRDAFHREILHICSCCEEAYQLERGLVTEETLADPLCLNLISGGGRTEWDRRQLSGILSKKWEDPDFRERMLKILKERSEKSETRLRISAGVKRAWEDLETRDRMMEAMRGKKKSSVRERSQEEREKTSMTLKEQWSDPEFRERRVEAMRLARERRGSTPKDSQS